MMRASRSDPIPATLVYPTPVYAQYKLSKETIYDSCSEKGIDQESTPVQKLGKKSDGRMVNAPGTVFVCCRLSVRLKLA
jgi:hypothetical protein